MLLILGLDTRILAAAIVVDMMVAIALPLLRPLAPDCRALWRSGELPSPRREEIRAPEARRLREPHTW